MFKSAATNTAIELLLFVSHAREFEISNKIDITRRAVPYLATRPTREA